MKTKFVIVGVLVANAALLWCLAHHYEFHTGGDGQVIWRCNNFTGEADYSLIGNGEWIAVSGVSSPKPFVPPRPEDIIKPASTNK